jgi:DNA-binding transcriptional LysR family regulator
LFEKSNKGNNTDDIFSAIAMSSIRLLIAFAESAKLGSFSRAARELGLSPSAVAKNVARLEESLAVRLFHRTTRRVGLTQDGEALYERCRRVLDELAEIEAAAASASRGPTGTLRIDAPATYGKQVIVPLVADLARRHPDLRIDVRLSDSYADVIGGGLDAVIRVGPIDDSRLVARAFDVQLLGTYAAPDYLSRRGRPRTPADIDTHDCGVFRMPTTGRERPWQFLLGGESVAMHPRARFVMNDGEGLVSAACSGIGLVQVPDHMARAAVEAGRLEEVLARFRGAPIPISVVYPGSRQVPLRLRVFIDALVALRSTGRRSSRMSR